MTRDLLEAFLAAAAELDVEAVNYIGPSAAEGRERPIVSIDAGSRAATVVIASALGMPAPREVEYNGRRWLSSSVAEPELYLDIRSSRDDVGLTNPVIARIGGVA